MSEAKKDAELRAETSNIVRMDTDMGKLHFTRDDIAQMVADSELEAPRRRHKIYLVHDSDSGVYLMEFGGLHVYAQGCNPMDGDIFDRCCKLVGNDDYAAPLPIGEFKEFLRSDATTLILHVRTSGVSVSWSHHES